MDTCFVTAALAEWNRRKGTTHTWDQLVPDQQSEAMLLAQELKLTSNGQAE